MIPVLPVPPEWAALEADPMTSASVLSYVHRLQAIAGAANYVRAMWPVPTTPAEFVRTLEALIAAVNALDPPTTSAVS